MASVRPSRAAWGLAALLAAAAASAGWSVLRTPADAGEARLLGPPGDGAAPCPPAPDAPVLDGLGCAWPGVAGAAPALAAAGARPGGLAGARVPFAAAGLALVLLVHRTASGPRWGRRGLLAGAALVALGVPLQLAATAHPRALAALLLCAAAALLDGDAPGAPRRAAWIRAALAGAAAGAAVTATPAAALLAVPMALAVAAGRRDRRGAAFVAAAAAVLAASALAGGAAPWSAVGRALAACPPGGWRAVPPRLALLLDGLAMPLLLATFAVFHRDGAGRAAASLAVAGAAFLVALLDGGLDHARTVQLLAFCLLAPAAGVGVARMSETFAAGNPWRPARPLFTAAILVVAAVYGVDRTRALRQERAASGPSGSPAVAEALRGDLPGSEGPAR